MLDKINDTYRILATFFVVALSVVVLSAFVLPDYIDVKEGALVEWEESKEKEEKDFEEDIEEEKLLEEQHLIKLSISSEISLNETFDHNYTWLTRPVYDIITPPPETL